MKRLNTAKLTGLIGLAASLIAIMTWLGINPPHVGGKQPAPKKTNTKITRITKRPTTAKPKLQEQRFDASTSPVAGAWQYHAEKVAIGGKVFDGYGTLSAGTPFATFDVAGAETFTCAIGVNDNHASPALEFEVALEAGGQLLWNQLVKANRRPETLQVTLKGQRSVTLRCVKALHADGTPFSGELTDLVFAEPKVTK